MNIIFLDIDGVLNDKEHFIRVNDMFDTKKLNNIDRRLIYIDCTKLNLLKEICDLTGSKVVVTSSWKFLDNYNEIEAKLIELGIPIIGKTKYLSYERGKGIKEYIEENNIKSYIVLDDQIFEDYDKELLNHLVKTSFDYGGLTIDHKDEIVKKLTKC